MPSNSCGDGKTRQWLINHHSSHPQAHRSSAGDALRQHAAPPGPCIRCAHALRHTAATHLWVNAKQLSTGVVSRDDFAVKSQRQAHAPLGQSLDQEGASQEGRASSAETDGQGRTTRGRLTSNKVELCMRGLLAV